MARRRRPRRGGLGLSSKGHSESAIDALKDARRLLSNTTRAARRGDCTEVMANYEAAWANYGIAYANIVGMDRGRQKKQLMTNVLGIAQRARKLGDTVVFQCTRKR